MSYKEYEEQWFHNLNKIEKQCFKLKDCKVCLGTSLKLNLNSEIPLLRSSCVAKHYVMSLYDDIMTHVNLERIQQGKPVTLFSFKNSIISNFYCVKDVDNTLHFTVEASHVNWVTAVPVIVAAFNLAAKKLCCTYGMTPGKIQFNFSMVTLTASKEELKTLKSNYKSLEVEDHYFKEYGIVAKFDPTLQILNYTPRKNCYPNVVEYEFVYLLK